MRARKAENGGTVLSDERALDLGFAVTAVDQALDVGALAIRLRRLGDVQGDFAGDAHHLPLDHGQRGARARCRCGGARWTREGACGEQDGERASHPQELSASTRARLRNAWPISPRERATTLPRRSTMKLSGS